MSYADEQYHTLLQELVELAANTSAVENRTDTNTFSLFGRQMRFNLAEGFPLLTTKKVHFKSVVSELLWFLRGDTNIKYLLERDNHIWTDWRFKAFKEHCEATGQVPPETMKEFEKNFMDGYIDPEWGDIGKGYGHQWRNFGADYIETDHYDGETKDFLGQAIPGFDQISWVINEIKTNPSSRRLIVSGWNPHEVDKVDLPPCHTLFQFHVSPMSLDERKRWVDNNYPGGGLKAIVDHHRSKRNEEREQWAEVDNALVCDFAKAPTHKLSCQLYQRSADVFLGVPFNIASYALLTQMIAQVCGLGLGDFVWTGGDVHLYENHLEQAKLQLSRDSSLYPAPKLQVDTQGKTIFDITEKDIHLTDYEHFPPIKAPVAV